MRAVVGNLGEGVESVDSRENLTAFLGQQRLGSAPDGLAVVDDQHLETLERTGPEMARTASLVAAASDRNLHLLHPGPMLGRSYPSALKPMRLLTYRPIPGYAGNRTIVAAEAPPTGDNSP